MSFTNSLASTLPQKTSGICSSGMNFDLGSARASSSACLNVPHTPPPSIPPAMRIMSGCISLIILIFSISSMPSSTANDPVITAPAPYAVASAAFPVSDFVSPNTSIWRPPPAELVARKGTVISPAGPVNDIPDFSSSNLTALFSPIFTSS